MDKTQILVHLIDIKGAVFESYRNLFPPWKKKKLNATFYLTSNFNNTSVFFLTTSFSQQKKRRKKRYRQYLTISIYKQNCATVNSEVRSEIKICKYLFYLHFLFCGGNKDTIVKCKFFSEKKRYKLRIVCEKVWTV